MFFFREITSADYAAVCSLFHSAEELYLVYPKGKFPLTHNQLVELQNKRKSLTVLLYGEKVIGFANLYGFKEGMYAFIGNVIVDKAYRGQGLGKKFVQYMENLAAKVYGLPEIRISVFEDNPVAIKLYGKLGYRKYDEEKRQNPKGQVVSLFHLKKNL